MTTVVDASAFIRDLAEGARSSGDRSIHVPELFDLEVLWGLRRGLLHGVIGAERFSEAVEDLRDFRATRHRHLRLIPRISELRNNFTPYDASYVALAERLGASLMTADAQLARAVRAHTQLEVIS